MKRTEKQSIAAALRAELERAQDTKIEMRGIFLLTAGYVRSLPVLGYTPSESDVDFVAFALEEFSKRLDAECNQMNSIADLACGALKGSKRTRATG